MSSKHREIKLKISHETITRKPPNIWKLSDIVISWYQGEIGSKILEDTKILRCSRPLYKRVYLHITYAQPPVYLNHR